MATTGNFTTLDTAALLDHLCEAHDAAKALAAGDARWSSALDRAWGWLLQTDAISYDADAHAIRVESASEPGRVYVANGACGCSAFAAGKACWHRAAARLMRRALELREQHEVMALAAELHAEALEAGDFGYTQEIALAGARSRMEGLQRVAEDWDALAAELHERIGRAWAARAMAA
jgi:hypothetical protein